MAPLVCYLRTGRVNEFIMNTQNRERFLPTRYFLDHYFHDYGSKGYKIV